jgi:asparagine synthase (glutamine-hydrolysing)
VSGIVGIFQRDGSSVEPITVRRLTEFLEYRGPDGLITWSGGPAGLGQAIFSASGRSKQDYREATRFPQLHIAGDVRLDAVEELRAKLVERGQRLSATVAPLELVLGAYAIWGVECTTHLRGDYAFGIWDESIETMFCARDHFGVKPFYFHDSTGLFLFSNTLNCLRQYPTIRDEPNESAIGDFLLFGLNRDKGTTTFKAIRRLPPAHWLLATKQGLRMERYWKPPTDERIRYRTDEEYIEHFLELLKLAVSDRVSAGRSGVLLSGGLDSGAVMAMARNVAGPDGSGATLQSYTAGYGSRDAEGFYARKTAEHLGIPNAYVSLDVGLFEEPADPAYRLPEPVDDPLSAALFKQFEFIGKGSRVVLSGEGADNLMYFQMWPYLKELRRSGEWSRLLSEATRFAAIRPVPWLGAVRRFSTLFRRTTNEGQLPGWIAPEFAKRANLLERLREGHRPAFPAERHPTRPNAHASMLLPEWGRLFELTDPGVTRSPVEVRYPFLDLRVVSYLLAIPPFPWCYRKTLIRRAMRDSLPQEVLRRAKTPLQEDPLMTRLSKVGIASVRSLNLDAKTWEYIRREKLAIFCDTMRIEDLRPYCLGVWLRGVGQE